MDSLIISNSKGDSITLSNTAPYFLERLDGVGSLDVEMQVQKAPRQDGSTYFDNTLTSRALSIEGMIMVRGDEEAVFRARRKIEEVLNPKLGEVTVAYRDKEIKAIAESISFLEKTGWLSIGNKFVLTRITGRRFADRCKSDASFCSNVATNSSSTFL